jgi:hypothetical protein
MSRIRYVRRSIILELLSKTVRMELTGKENEN